ncbi:MAG: hypothetical protein WA080_01930 [Sulfuricurvum sp.]
MSLPEVRKNLEQGLEKGLEQKSIQIAKNLLDILDNHTISRKTGLILEGIEALLG